MLNTDQYKAIWSHCEYFLEHGSRGVNLNAFDLIGEKIPGKASRDVYAFERLTRPALARGAKQIKTLARETVSENRLGEVETRAGTLLEELKDRLYREIKTGLDRRLAEEIRHAWDAPESRESLLVLASLYYAYFMNKNLPGYSIPGFYFKVFFPCLVLFHKGDRSRIDAWLDELHRRFSDGWHQENGYDLAAIFNHESVRKIVSLSFACLLEFINKSRERAVYLFEVGNGLTRDALDAFKIQVANGLCAALEREGRGALPPDHAGGLRALPVAVIQRDLIEGTIGRTVDRYFDSALDLAVHYYMTGETGIPRARLLRQFDKVFVKMNREFWQDLLALAAVRKREACRTRHLLRVVIHYMFERKGIQREFWKKYIPSVEKIIHYTYKDDRELLDRMNQRLAVELARFGNQDPYEETDWEGFYRASSIEKIVRMVLETVEEKAVGRDRSGLPSIWFSNLVAKGIDDKALLRFFRQGLT